MKKALLIAILLFGPLGSQITLAQDFSGHPNGVLSSAGKRFVFGQISKYGNDQYMLDTETGRLWRIVQDENKTIFLEAVRYIMLNGKKSLIAPSQEQDLKSFTSDEKQNK